MTGTISNTYISGPYLIALVLSLSTGCAGSPESPAVGSGSPADSSCTLRQTTPGSSQLMEGYTLISTHIVEGGDGQTLLVDMQGRTVQSWKLHGFPAQMLPGGSVMGTKSFRSGDLLQHMDSIDLVRQSWDGEELWSYGSWDADDEKFTMSRQHHDYQRAPNPVGYYAPGQDASPDGLTLVLGHKTRKVPAVSDQEITDDVIYEVRSDGGLTGFTWYAADHIEEMGFGPVARAQIKKGPDLEQAARPADWLHLNSMSRVGRNHWYERDGDSRFHPDNIIISSRDANMLAIIDRATGRIVWRVGPDYSEGTPWHDLDQLIGQHHAHIIPHGLPGAGNVLVFDNGGLAGHGEQQAIRTHSRVLEFNPVTLEKVWEYDPRDRGVKFFSTFIGSAQRLPNGNTLVADGQHGQLMEVNSAGEILWSYQSGEDVEKNRLFIYRAYRVPPEWLPGAAKAAYPAWRDLYACPG